MARKILLILFAISLIFALIGVWERHLTDRSASGVELIMDYDAISELIDREKLQKDEYLRSLHNFGLTAIAVYPDTIENLLKQGKIILLTGNEVQRIYSQTGSINPLLEEYPYGRDSVFIIINDLLLRQKFLQKVFDWKNKYGIDYSLNSKQLVLYFDEWKSKYINLSLGFNQQLITSLREMELKVIPRINNNKLDNEINWIALREISPDYVIFSGQEITGYKPDGSTDLYKTADIMNKNNIIFGMIESFIAHQQGVVTLAYKTNFNLLRVHSIQQAEMDSNKEKYTLNNIVDRYLRAVKERNVRLLYLKPFLTKKENLNPGQLTLKYVGLLHNRLKNNGYKPGSIDTYQQLNTGKLQLLISSIGIILAGILLVTYLSGIDNQRIYWILLALSILIEVVIVFSGRIMLLRKVLALATSIIFPSIAVISQVFYNKKDKLLLRFIKANLISFIGVVFLIAAMGHLSFILKVDQFTGVKLSFIMPILFITYYYIRVIYDRPEIKVLDGIKTILDMTIKIKHLVLLGILAVGAFVYIGRTGNYPTLPVPNFEIYFRELLEDILYVRPRFKEFMIGHPFLLLGLGIFDKIRNKIISFIMLLLATIGQINILNTFSHAHTPVVISFIRVFHGIWLGALLGYILLWIVKKVFLQRGLFK